MKKKDRLKSLISKYRNNLTDSSTHAVINFLQSETLYFQYYFIDCNGTERKAYASHLKGNGEYFDTVPSSKFYPQTFDLIEVIPNFSDKNIFVSIESLSFDDENLKGTNTFTQQEANEIIALIDQKLKAGKDEQKKIRDKIRDLGFYSTDFGMNAGYGYTVEDFKRVVKII